MMTLTAEEPELRNAELTEEEKIKITSGLIELYPKDAQRIIKKINYLFCSNIFLFTSFSIFWSEYFS